MTQVDYGYLETDYLTTPYLTEYALANYGLQFESQIDTQDAYFMEFESNILDSLVAKGLQFESNVIDFEIDNYLELESKINAQQAFGLQIESNILDSKNQYGLQFESQIDGTQQLYGIEFISSNMLVVQCPKYLYYPYLTDTYLNANDCGSLGLQFESMPSDVTHTTNLQFESEINFKQDFGLQMEFFISTEVSYGVQFDSQTLTQVGLQFLSTLYNTNRLRILCDFPSRGVTGENWTSNSTEPGDFSPYNLNTDIVEQIWRSEDGIVTGVNLDCDTEVPQGVFLDTFAMLNHNITGSATVQLIGATDPAFSNVIFSDILQITEENIFYISPDLPTTGVRYWRVAIDDASNGDGFIQVGTIVFGNAQIFKQECMTDEIDFQFRDFSDRVQTEGFTNVTNSRALKKRLQMDFRLQNFDQGDFKLIRGVFTYARTNLKCLWIPTPDPDDMEYTGRYAVFAKLTEIPTERHKVIRKDGDYVSYTINLDESM